MQGERSGETNDKKPETLIVKKKNIATYNELVIPICYDCICLQLFALCLTYKLETGLTAEQLRAPIRWLASSRAHVDCIIKIGPNAKLMLYRHAVTFVEGLMHSKWLALEQRASLITECGGQPMLRVSTILSFNRLSQFGAVEKLRNG